ncbi:NIF3-like protein 1 [Ruditapes philippinarum]|uniref:NIF3-like protein 1 n=1 Tax=Ruditapes philippinarum TaxID=129788 RepID=UPI00295AFADB|nr:NIF3-like protein 1 [Ruditapes philippinarum]
MLRSILYLIHKQWPDKPLALKFMYRRYCVTASENSSMELQNVLKQLRKLASPSLAGSWDNVGLLVEPSAPHKVSTIFLTNDLTPPVLDEAIKRNSDMIISYHPPIFSGMKKLVQKQWKDKIIIRCIKNKIAVYSPHTSYDCVEGGVNDWLISCFDCKSVEPVEQHEDFLTCHTHQVELDVAAEHTQLLREAFKAEQQVKITECRERSDGKHHLSVHCTKSSLKRVMSILQDKMDSVKNLQITNLEKAPTLGYGMGRKAKLNNSISLDEAVQLVKKHLKLDRVRLAKSPGVEAVSSVAVCAGSGGSVLRNVTADLYVTGEMSHHEVLHAVYNNSAVILCDHSNTERGYLTVLKSKLEECLDSKTNVVITEVDRDPLEIV